MPTPKPAAWFVLAALTLGLDQLTKLAVVNTMAIGQSIAVTDFFNLVYVLNTGAAFSFLADAGGSSPDWPSWWLCCWAG